jgi:hypothetical protein
MTSEELVRPTDFTKLRALARLLRACLFPYRAHLEEEVLYLRGLVSRKDRRLHELQEMLAQQGVRAVIPRDPKVAAIPVNLRPRGWEEYRRREREEQKEAVSREQEAVVSG